MSRFEIYYNQVLRYDLIVKHNYTNSYQVPQITAVYFHLTSSEALQDSKNIFPPMLALEMITGQKAHTIAAKHSNSTFKLRKGATVACHVTLRRTCYTYPALEKLITTVLPKEEKEVFLRGWRCDKQGNVSFGVSDGFAYKELEEEYDKFSKAVRGLQITVVMRTGTADVAGKKALLRGFQFPISS